MSDPQISEVISQKTGGYRRGGGEGVPLLAGGGPGPESLGPACPAGTCAGRPRGCGGIGKLDSAGITRPRSLPTEDSERRLRPKPGGGDGHRVGVRRQAAIRKDVVQGGGPPGVLPSLPSSSSANPTKLQPMSQGRGRPVVWLSVEGGGSWGRAMGKGCNRPRWQPP